MTLEIKYQTYLINLDRAKERFLAVDEQFQQAGVSYERFSAVDARFLDQEKYQINNQYTRDFIPGEIGCYLSHIKVLRKFLESDNQFAVIVEDDAKLASDYKAILEKALSTYQDLPANDQWDVLKLFNGKRRNIFVKKLDEKHFIGSCGSSIPITTLAAVWTRKGAEKFLNKVGKDSPIIKRPIDCELQFPWEYDLVIYNLLPSIMTSLNMPSQINQKSKGVKSKFLRKISYELGRVIPKRMYYIKQHGFAKFYESFIQKKNDLVK